MNRRVAAKPAWRGVLRPVSRRPYRPARFIEILEDRLLLAVAPSLRAQTATFEGDAADDSLYLRASGGFLEFSVSGQPDSFSSDLSPSPGLQRLLLNTNARIQVNLGDGNDQLRIDATLSEALRVPGSLIFDGGLGNDTLVAAAVDNLFLIEAANAGSLNASIAFRHIENLTGAENHDDQFVFRGGASLAGTVQGQAGDADSLRVEIVAPLPDTSAAAIRFEPTEIQLNGSAIVRYSNIASADHLVIHTSGTGALGFRRGAAAGTFVLESTGAGGLVPVVTLDAPAPDGSLAIDTGGRGRSISIAQPLGFPAMLRIGRESPETPDQLSLSGGNFTTATYNVSSADSGRLEHDLSSLSYRGIDRIRDLSTAGTRILNLGDSDDALSLGREDGGIMIQSLTKTFGRFHVAEPTAALTVRASGGNDSFTVQPLDVAAAVLVTLDGGDGVSDRLQYSVSAGPSAQNIAFIANGSDGGTVRVAGADVVTFAGIEDAQHLSIQATSGDDQIVLRPTAAGRLALESSNARFGAIEFAQPAGSLTIDAGAGNDSITVPATINFAAALALHGNDGSDRLTLAGSISSLIYGSDSEVIDDQSVASHRSFTATPMADRMRLSRDAASGRLALHSENGTFARLVFADPTESLSIHAGSGDDTITVELADLNPELILEGGAGLDRIVVEPGTFSRISTSAEALTDNSTAAVREFTAPDRGPSSPLNHDQIRIRQGGRGRIIVESLNDGFVPVSFPEPTTRLIVRAGPGNDSFVIEALTLQAALEIQGDGGNDIVQFNGDLNLPGRDLVVAAERISVARTISTRQADAAGRSTGNSGHITFDAVADGTASISLKNRAQLLSHVEPTSSFLPGTIVLSARSFESAFTPFVHLKDTKSTITVGDEFGGATILGGQITIDARADSASRFSDQSEPAEVALDVLEAVLSPIVGVAISNAVSQVTVKSGSRIEGMGMNLRAVSRAESFVITLSSGLGGAYGESNPNAAVLIETGATLRSHGDLTLSSKATSFLSITASVLTLGEAKGFAFDLVFAAQKSSLNSTVHVAAGADLTVIGGDLRLSADATKNHNIKALAGAYENGTLGIAATVSLATSTTHALLDGQASVDGDVHVNAALTTIQNDAASGAAAGSGIAVAALLSPKISYNRFQAYRGKQEPGPDPRSGKRDPVAISAAVTFMQHRNEAIARVGDPQGTSQPAVVSSRKSIRIESNVVDIPETSSIASVDSAGISTPRVKENSGSAAVVVGLVENDAQAAIAPRAVVDSAGSLRVHAAASFPFLAPYSQQGFQPANVLDFTNTNLGIQNSLFSSWAQASASADKIGVAGSVNYMRYRNRSDAYIAENAFVNQNSAAADRPNQHVEVSAISISETVNLSGAATFLGLPIIYIPVLGKTFAGARARDSVGIAYMQVDYTHTTFAHIDRAARVDAATIRVDADSLIRNVSITEAGAEARRLGFIGSFGLLRSNNDTVAQIDDGAFVTAAGNQPGNAADNTNVIVNARDRTHIVNAAGSILKGSNRGGVAIGLSAAVNEVTRRTEALIGNRVASAQSDDDGFVRSFHNGDVRVAARNDGYVAAGALAGTISVNAPPEPQPESSPAGTFGIGISADVTVNTVHDTTLAYVRDADVATDPDPNAQVGLALSADNSTRFVAASGQIAISDALGTSLGLGGAAAVNRANLRTQAFVQDSQLTLSDPLTLEARLPRLQDATSVDAPNFIALAASIDAAVSDTGIAVAVAGQVAVNEVENTTETHLTGSAISVRGKAVHLSSDDRSFSVAVAGALVLGGKAGIGASAALQKIRNQVATRVHESSVSADSLVMGATAGMNVDSAAAAIGASKAGMAVEVQVAATDYDLDAVASVTGTRGDGMQLGAGGVELRSRDDSDLRSIAGNVVFNLSGQGTAAASIGIAAGTNEIDQTVRTQLDAARIESQGPIVLHASATPSIFALTVSGVGAHTATAGGVAFAGAGAGSGNTIRSVIEALVDESDVVTTAPDSSIGLTAVNESEIQADAGGVSIAAAMQSGGALSVGISAAINSLNSAVRATIERSEFRSAKHLTLESRSDSRILAVSIGGSLARSGAGSGLGIAGAGAGSRNSIQQDVRAIVSASRSPAGPSIRTSNGGGVAISAHDDSAIRAIAGGVAVSFLSGGASGSVTASVGVSAAVNDISGSVVARMDDSVVLSDSDVLLSARSRATIFSLTIGGDLSGSGGAGGGTTIGGAGAGSSNRIRQTINASMHSDSAITTQNGGKVQIHASDAAAIHVVSGGISFAFANGQAAGVAGSAGASVSINDISNVVTADIDRSSVDAAGSLELIASESPATPGDPNMRVLSIAGSVSGSTGSVDLAGAGARTDNSVRNTIRAAVTQSDAAYGHMIQARAGSVSLDAADESHMHVVSGGIALAVIPSGQSGGIAASVGVSLADSTIRNTVRATIDETTLHAAGSIDLTARSKAQIDTLALAGTLAAAVSQGVGVGLSGTGAQATNTIANSIEASVVDGSRVTTAAGSTGSVHLAARDQATITARAGESGLSVSTGGTTGAAAAGGSVTRNVIANSTRAFVDSSTVTSDRDLELSATAPQTNTIDALAFGVNAAIAAGTSVFSAGAAIAGAGASSTNKITSRFESFIQNGSTITTRDGGTVRLASSDSSKIRAHGGAGALSGSVTLIGGSITVAVAIAENEIGNSIGAWIGGSLGNGSSYVDSDAVSLDAHSTAVIEALTVAVDVGFATAFSLAGGGARSTNTSASTIAAMIQDGSVTSDGSVSVAARDRTSVRSEVGAGSLGIGLASGSVGVSLASDTIHNTVLGSIRGATVTSSTGDISVLGESTSHIENTRAVATSISIGAGGTGTNATATISGRAEAFVDDDAQLTASNGNVAVQVTADWKNAPEARGGGIAAVEIDVMLAQATIDAVARAWIGSATVTGKTVRVTSLATNRQAKPRALFVNLAAVGGGGGNSKGTIDGSIEAYLGSGADVRATGGPVVVRAESANTADARGDGLAGGGVGVGAITVDAKIRGATRAYIQPDADVRITGGLDMDAVATDTANASTLIVGIRTIGGNGAQVDAQGSHTTETYIGSQADLTVTGGPVTMDATSAHSVAADGRGGSGGVVSVAVIVVAASLDGSTRSSVGESAHVTAPSLHMTAATTRGDVRATTLLVGIAATAGTGSSVDADVSHATETVIESLAQITADGGTIRLDATSTYSATSDARGGSGGTVNITGMRADSDANGRTRVSVAEAATIRGGALQAVATGGSTANATTFVVGIGVLGGQGARATANAIPTVEALVGPSGPAGAPLPTSITLTAGALLLRSNVTATAEAKAEADGGQVTVNAGASIAEAAASPTVTTSIGNDAVVMAGGQDVDLASADTSRANARADGINVAGGLGAAGSTAKSSVQPNLTTRIGDRATIRAANVRLASRHNVDATGQPVTTHRSEADARAGAGALVGAGSGTRAQAFASPNVRTTVDSSSTIAATGAVVLRTQSYQIADADASSITVALGIGVGVTLPEAEAKGKLHTHLDGTIESAATVTIETDVTAEATARGQANGGALFGAGNGTNVRAIVGDPTEALVRTFVAGTAAIRSSGDVTIRSLVRSDAKARASAVTLAAGASVGSTPATAIAEPRIETFAATGADIRSTSGNIALVSGHNFDRDNATFFTDRSAQVTSDGDTISLVVSVAATDISADSRADLDTRLEPDATLAAPAGNVSLEAYSSNRAGAEMENDAGAAISVSAMNPSATAAGKTRARLLGHVRTVSATDETPGARNLVVVAQAFDAAKSQFESDSGGVIQVGSSTARATSSPAVDARLGSGTVRASQNITVRSISISDADATADSSSGGVVDVANFRTRVVRTPSVATTIADNAVITAGGTIEWSATHGTQPAATSDGTFDAASAVDVSANTITFPADHALAGGNSVTYRALNQTGVGGLRDRFSYGALPSSDRTIRLGAAFQPERVIAATDSLLIGGLNDGDRVLYELPPGSSPIGGLVAGRTYQVRQWDPDAIKLIDPANPPAPAIQFNPALGVDTNGDGSSDSTTLAGKRFFIPSHGFTHNQPVSYRAPRPVTFIPGMVDVVLFAGPGSNLVPQRDAAGSVTHSDSNNIYIGTHNFANGDRVIYRVPRRLDGTPSAPAIGGLVDGRVYRVMVDNSVSIRLSETSGALAAIAINGSNTSGNHSIARESHVALGKLTDGLTYYVRRIDANQFELATAPNGSAMEIDAAVGGVAVSGMHSLGTEAIDITSQGAGPQRLIIDLTSTGSGVQRLEGVGGAVRFAGAPSGDGVISSSATGSGGGVIAVGLADSEGTSIPTVGTMVGRSVRATATDLLISASSASNGSATSSRRGGGLIEVGDAEATIDVNNQVTTTIGGSSVITARRDVVIRAVSTQVATAEAATDGGGLVDFADSESAANINFTTRVVIGSGTAQAPTRVTADNGLTLLSESSVHGSSSSFADADGLGSDADANDSPAGSLGVRIGPSSALTQSTVGGHAQLKGNMVSVLAQVHGMRAQSVAETDADALGADSDATARTTVADRADVTLESGAELAGHRVELRARHLAVDLTSAAFADCSCGGGDSDAQADTDYQSTSSIHAESNARITAADILVEVKHDILNYHRSASRDAAFIDTGDRSEGGDLNAMRTITWNADVELIGPSAALTVDANGRIQHALNVTVRDLDNPAKAAPNTQILDTDILINPIVNSTGGKIRFEADAQISRDSRTSPPSKIQTTATPPTFTFRETFESVSIMNGSDKDLVVHGIDVVHDPNLAAPGAAPRVHPRVEVAVQDGPGTNDATPFRFRVDHRFTPTRIEIVNHGNSDIGLSGHIRNPIGSTTIRNVQGEILNGGDVRAGGTPARVESNTLTFVADAGSVGAGPDSRIAVELVESSGRPSELNLSAADSVHLELVGLLRGPAAALSVRGTRVEAGRAADLRILASKRQVVSAAAAIPISVFLDPPYGQPEPNNPLRLAEFFRPDLPATLDYDIGVFGTGDEAIDATYVFTQSDGSAALVGIGDVVIRTADTSTAAKIDFVGTSALRDSAQLTMVTNGRIMVTQSAGDLNIAEIRSTAGDVTLAVTDGDVLDAEDDAASDVTGNHVTLLASGGIGQPGNEVEIDTAVSAAGQLSASATRDIHLFEVAGDLILTRVAIVPASGGLPGRAFLRSQGAILAGSAGPVIEAGAAILRAAAGVGRSDNSLVTSIPRLECDAGTGGVFVENRAALTIGQASDLAGCSGDSHVLISATSPLTVAESIFAGGRVELTAAESLLYIDHLVIRRDVTVQSARDAIVVRAGDDVHAESGSIIRAATSVSIHGDTGASFDPALGSVIALLGQIFATSVEIIGNENDDLITLRHVGPGVGTAIRAGAGNDVVQIGSDPADDDGDLDNVQMRVTIEAGDGTDLVYVNDRGKSGAVNYAIGPSFILNLPDPSVAPRDSFAGITYDASTEFLRMDGNDAANVFDVQPSRATEYFIDGNLPDFGTVCAARGDYLRLDTRDTTGRTLEIFARGRGRWTFTSPHRPVEFEDMERFNHVDIVAAASDAGTQSRPRVQVFDAETFELKFEFLAYEATYRQGVRVATGDIDNDGLPDIVTAPGRNRVPELRVFRGTPQAGLSGTEAAALRVAARDSYGDRFSFGLRVAAGDVTGDGCPDIVTAPGRGKAIVKVFENDHGSALRGMRSFDAFADQRKFIGGASVAVTDSDGNADANQRGDIVVASGSGMPATVRVFDVTAARTHYTPIRQFSDPMGFRGGYHVATADVDGDGIADIITASGPGGQSWIRVYDGAAGSANTPVHSFQAFVDASRSIPVSLTARDIDNDDRAEIFAAQGQDGRNDYIIKRIRPLDATLIDSVLAKSPDFFGGGLFLG